MKARRLTACGAASFACSLVVASCGGGGSGSEGGRSTTSPSATATAPPAPGTASPRTATTTERTSARTEERATSDDRKACRQAAAASVDAAEKTNPWIGTTDTGQVEITLFPDEFDAMQQDLETEIVNVVQISDDQEAREHASDLLDAVRQERPDETTDSEQTYIDRAYDFLLRVDDGMTTLFLRCTELGVDVTRERLSTAGAEPASATSTSTTSTEAPTTTVAPTTTALPQLDPLTVAQFTSVSDSARQTACDGDGFFLSTIPFDERTLDRLCAGEVPDPALQPPPLTVDDLNSILGPPAAEWIAAPSGTSYDALAAAARSIIESGRAVPIELVDDPRWLERGGTAWEVVAGLTSYPQNAAEGGDFRVFDWLSYLALPLIEVPFVLQTGSYLVGAEVPPGTYRATEVTNCYWETLDEAGEINDNNFVSSAPQVLMTVRASDFAVNNDCETMVKVD